jgi:hypothetical protein
MQPELALTYNSGAGNGWLGLGWSLDVPSITIDTRWGVPRYDNKLETETYQLNGEMLAAVTADEAAPTSVAHRGALRDRRASQAFYTRIDTSFSKIVRHNNDPSSYWWEVTGKDGTSYFYGGTPGPNSPDPKAVLADYSSAGNIYRWLLKEVRDPHGNTIVYSYDVVNGTGDDSWRQVYLEKIEYTGTNGANPAYVVSFKRDEARPDPIVDCRPGFKTKMTQRLSDIEISLSTPGISAPETDTVVRSYRLDYQPNAPFGKSLLSKVTQCGDDGSEFNHHEFSYFNEVQWTGGSQLTGFKPTQSIENAKVIRGNAFNLLMNSSAFGAEAGKSDGGEGRLGIAIGAPTDYTSGHISAGGSSSDSNMLLALIDLDGDFLPDQVYGPVNDSVYYRSNAGSPGRGLGFAQAVPPTLTHRQRIGHESSSAGQLAWRTRGRHRNRDLSGPRPGGCTSKCERRHVADLIAHTVCFNRAVRWTSDFRSQSVPSVRESPRHHGHGAADTGRRLVTPPPLGRSSVVGSHPTTAP